MRSRFIRFIQRADVESTQIVNYDIGYHNSLKECESCNEKGDLRNEDLEEIRGRAYEDRGRAILGRHEKELYLRGFPFYHEGGVSLCHCLEVQ